MKRIIYFLSLILFISACDVNPKDQKEEEISKRIVSLNGTLTEIIFELGEGQSVVGIDVTSTFPKTTEKIQNLGHIKGLNKESLLALNPTHVLAFSDEVSPELKKTLKDAKVELIAIKREFSIKGTEKVVSELASLFGKEEKANAINVQISKSLEKVAALKNPPRVLFVYARGAGTLMVGGEGTPIEKVIELAGGTNAANGFQQYKPLTSEAVVAANPDFILMFDSGAESLGPNGVFEMPGVSLTNAGKNKKLITMDGLLLSGFGPRVGYAVQTLNKEFQKK